MRLLIAVLLLLVPAAAREWPFGGKGIASTKLDLYNLGLLGAKARDAAGPAPEENAPPESGRRVVEMGESKGDDGPERLLIELLYPGGPADKAGLVRGDVVVGVGTKRFSKGSLETIAKALVKAESSKGLVTLLVERGGKGKAEKVVVTIAKGTRYSAKPTEGKGRDAIVDAALAWLAEKQQEDGGYPETLSGSNGAVVQTSLAGLAWLGDGNALKRGKYRKNVRLAAEFVVAKLPGIDDVFPGAPRGGPSWNQSNWGLAHACMFLGELNRRTRDRGIEQALHEAAARLARNQEKSGGWAHGPGGKNALGYLELNIVTGLALCGLGLAEQSGFEIPEGCLEKAEEYLKDSSSGDGGVGYSTDPGQKGQGNIGRSAAAWLGYLALGKGKTAWGKKLEAYVRRNAGKVLEGHASLMQHVLLAGLAAHAQGGAAEKDYWEAMERDLILARTPDGSLQPRPWHESLSMQSNSDVTFGDVWTTAAWAIVLTSETPKDGKRGFPGLFGTKRK